MNTAHASSGAPQVPAGREVPVRPPLVRGEDRVLAGVCSGLARHLGLKASTVRWVLALSTVLYGAGAVFYGWLWVTVPTAAEGAKRSAKRPASAIAPAVSAPAPETGEASGEDAGRGGLRLGREVVLGVAMLVAAVVLGLGLLGGAFTLAGVIPMAAILAGAVLAWTQLDDSRREQLVRGAGAEGRGGWLRLVAGLALVVTGVTFALVGNRWDVLGSALLASLAVLVGVALVLLPWGLKFWRDLGSERAARVREEERAEIAAHLHDSVLQTLALIQRRAGHEGEVVRLARAQERELREWLYQDSRGEGGSFPERLRALAAEVEDGLGQTVELVCVGERDPDDRGEALLQAAREAMFNAARHGGGPVSVYAEMGAESTEVFVKDRGPGFDPEAVPADRLGIRESIVGRMRRHGGDAKISTGSDGTEVRLRLPRTEEI